jgi:hypothetical protein
MLSFALLEHECLVPLKPYLQSIGLKGLAALWASPDSPDTFNNMMCSGDINDEDKKELHGRVQA